MKSLTLLFLSLAIAPAYALIGRGAVRESWPLVVLGAALVAAAYGAVRYLIGD